METILAIIATVTLIELFVGVNVMVVMVIRHELKERREKNCAKTPLK